MATYVFQSTTFSDYFFPVNRVTCEYKKEIVDPKLQNSKIGMIVLYGESINGEWGPEIMGLVMENRYRYAKHHGYDVIEANDLIEKSRPIAWSKLLAVKQHLQDYDYLFYIDMDAVSLSLSFSHLLLL
jgi:hypothetical protein